MEIIPDDTSVGAKSPDVGFLNCPRKMLTYCLGPEYPGLSTAIPGISSAGELGLLEI